MKDIISNKEAMCVKATEEKKRLDTDHHNKPSVMKSIKCFIAKRRLSSIQCDIECWNTVKKNHDELVGKIETCSIKQTNDAIAVFKDAKETIIIENKKLEENIQNLKSQLQDNEEKVKAMNECMTGIDGCKTGDYDKSHVRLKAIKSEKKKGEGIISHLERRIDKNAAELEKAKNKNDYFSYENSTLNDFINNNIKT
ncbi:MAG: hypothetical protein KAG53_00310 [Endozoicomonadaceae bacterium]|nr:hypothetical protein [Endozoicomonadaceae bacterium]